MHTGAAAAAGAAGASSSPPQHQPASQMMFARAAPTNAATSRGPAFAPKLGSGPQLSVYSAGPQQQQQQQHPLQQQQRAPMRRPASQQNPFFSQPLQQQGLQQVHSQQLQRQAMMQQEAVSVMQRGPPLPARFNPALHATAGGLSQPTHSSMTAAPAHRTPLSFAGFDADDGRSYTPPARAQPYARSPYSAAAQSMPFSLSQQPVQSSRAQSAMEVRTQDDSGWSGRGQQQEQRQQGAQARFAHQHPLSQQQHQSSPSLSGQKHRLSEDSLAAQEEAKVQRMAAAGGMRVSLTQQREGQSIAPAAQAKQAEEEKVEAEPSIEPIQVEPVASEAAVPAPVQDASMEVATISAPAVAAAESQSQPSIAPSSSDTQETQATTAAPSLQEASQMAREDSGEIVADTSSQDSFVIVQQDSAAAEVQQSDPAGAEAAGPEIPASAVAADDGSSQSMAIDGAESGWSAAPQIESQIDSQRDQVLEQGTSLQSVPDSSMAQPEEVREHELPQPPAVAESVIEIAPAPAVESAVPAAPASFEPAVALDQVAENQRIEPPIIQEEAGVAAAAAEVEAPVAAAASVPPLALHLQKKGSGAQSLPMPEVDDAEEEANQQMDDERKDDKAEPVRVTPVNESHPSDPITSRARADAYGDASDNDLSNEAILFSDDASAQAAAPAGLGFIRASSMLPTAFYTASIPQDTQSLIAHVQDCLVRLASGGQAVSSSSSGSDSDLVVTLQMKLTESQARERMLSAQLAAMAGIEEKVRTLETGKRSMQSTHRNELAAKERVIAELQKKTREHQEHISSLQGSQSLMHESLAEIAGIAQSAVQTGQ